MSARGEGFLGELPVLFTNRALADAERKLGRTITEILSAASGGRFGISETASLLAIGLEYGRRDRKESRANYTEQDAYNLMDEHGWSDCAKMVIEAISTVLTYEAPSDPPA